MDGQAVTASAADLPVVVLNVDGREAQRTESADCAEVGVGHDLFGAAELGLDELPLGAIGRVAQPSQCGSPVRVALGWPRFPRRARSAGEVAMK